LDFPAPFGPTTIHIRTATEIAQPNLVLASVAGTGRSYHDPPFQTAVAWHIQTIILDDGSTGGIREYVFSKRYQGLRIVVWLVVTMFGSHTA